MIKLSQREDVNLAYLRKSMRLLLASGKKHPYQVTVSNGLRSEVEKLPGFVTADDVRKLSLGYELHPRCIGMVEVFEFIPE